MLCAALRQLPLLQQPCILRHRSPAVVARAAKHQFTNSMAASSHPDRGGNDWPAPDASLAAGRLLLQQAPSMCKDTGRPVLLIPDKDADGLCAAGIVVKTLQLLGCPDVRVSPVIKGQHVHQPEVLSPAAAANPCLLVVLDQGSRSGALLPGVPTLVIDHHQPEGFPEGATVVSAAGSEPVATSSLLAYLLCRPLHLEVAPTTDWLAVTGTVGDLGATGVKQFMDRVPGLADAVKRCGSKHTSEAVSLINSARRAPGCDVATAWEAVSTASCPADIAGGRTPAAQKLQQFREQVRGEVDRCARTAPRFSSDGAVALIRINSPAQVHPVIAQRWTSRLFKNDRKGKLVAVMCANEGYLPGKVNFAVRTTSAPAEGGARPDLITFLQAAVAAPEQEALRQQLGTDFARGHLNATGGIIDSTVFDQLLTALHFSDAPAGGAAKSGAGSKRKQSSGTAGEEAGAAAKEGQGRQKKLTAMFPRIQK